MLKFLAERISTAALKPGDLFSAYGPDYWHDKRAPFIGVGAMVYIYTGGQPASGRHTDTFRITIIKEGVDD